MLKLKFLYGLKLQTPKNFTHRGKHEMLVLMAYVQKPPLKTHADVSRRARCLISGLSLPLLPYFVYARSDGSGETAPKRRLI